MSQHLSTSPQWPDPKTIVMVVLLLIVMTALAGCRSTRQTTEYTHVGHVTAQESIQEQSFRLDSLIRSLKLSADTLDIWITQSIISFDNGRSDESSPILLREIVVTPRGNDTLAQQTKAKGSATGGKSTGGYTPRIRTPTPSGTQSSLHIRAVGLQTEKQDKEFSKSSNLDSQSSLIDSTVQTTAASSRTKEEPWRFHSLLLFLVILAIGGAIIVCRWRPLLLKWVVRLFS